MSFVFGFLIFFCGHGYIFPAMTLCPLEADEAAIMSHTAGDRDSHDKKVKDSLWTENPNSAHVYCWRGNPWDDVT